jgi:hypothetical protein
VPRANRITPKLNPLSWVAGTVCRWVLLYRSMRGSKRPEVYWRVTLTYLPSLNLDLYAVRGLTRHLLRTHEFIYLASSLTRRRNVPVTRLLESECRRMRRFVSSVLFAMGMGILRKSAVSGEISPVLRCFIHSRCMMVLCNIYRCLSNRPLVL